MTIQEKNVLLDEGFTQDQITEIEEGIRLGLDVSVYSRKEYLAIQMYQIRMGMLEGLQVEKYADPVYDWFQMEEIRKGLQAGLDISKYASPEVPYDRMRQIRKGFLAGLDLSKYKDLEAGVLREFRRALAANVNIVKYIKAGYDMEQLREIRFALEKGVDLDPYLMPEFRGAAISEICAGLEIGVDVSSYAKPEFGWQQMREIRKGLENRVDTSLYTSVYYSWQQMQEIRLGLESGIDVSGYRSLMYTASDMRKKRLLLQGITDTEVPEKPKTLPVSVSEAEKKLGIFITVSPDGMEAYIKLEERGFCLTKEEVMHALELHGIQRGIIEGVIEKMAKGESVKAPALIAKGAMPTDGRDGWYEYFFRSDSEIKPKLLEDGSVDYQNTEWFEMVEQGQKIAYYHEAGEGTDGYTVSGRILHAKKGREKSLLAGRGFVLLPDQKTYQAVYSGKISLCGNRLEISRMLVLEEMTIATGRVDFDGAVYIRGNVGSGVFIRASEDVFVDGSVESANIESGGSVILRKGMNAFGSGSIRAAKNVVGKFFEAVQVYADGDIQANYCMNSSLYAKGKIIISGVKGTIVGGTAYSANGLQAYNVGNHVGLTTIVKLGINDSILKERFELDEEIKEVKRQMAIFRNTYVDLRKKYPPEIRNSMDIYLKIESAIFTKERQLDELEFQSKELSEKIQTVENVKAVIRGMLFEGVIIEMGGTRWSAKSVRNVTIKKVNGRIALYNNL